MKNSPDFVVVGSGGHAKVVIATIEAAGGKVLHLLDDNAGRWGERILGCVVKGAVTQELVPPDALVVVALGSNSARRAVAERLPGRFGVVAHPSAVIHPSATVGEGTVLFAGAIVQPEARVGRHCIINTAASVDHDCDIGDFVHIAPGAHLSGGVRVGAGSLIGIGASVIPGVLIGEGAIVGAGAAVVRLVESGTTVGGCPARLIGRV